MKANNFMIIYIFSLHLTVRENDYTNIRNSFIWYHLSLTKITWIMQCFRILRILELMY